MKTFLALFMGDPNPVSGPPEMSEADMARGMDQQKLAVQTGYWPLYRHDPRLRAEGKNPLQLDSKAPTAHLRDYIMNEARYRMLFQSNPEAAEHFLAEAQKVVAERWQAYEQLAAAN